MGKVRVFNNLSNLVDDQFRRFGAALLNEIVSVVNGKLDFVENIRASGPHTVSFDGTANQVVIVQHNLGKVPTGFLLISNQTSTAIITRAAPEWTASQASFASNLTGTVFDVLVYII